jgi:hypothetical protein
MTFLISCNSYKGDFKEINIEFYPAFIKPTKFTINLKNRTIEQYQYQTSIMYVDSSDSIKFGRIYGHPIKFKDTLIVFYKKTFQITKNDYNKFLQIVNENHLDSNIVHNRMVLDGVSFKLKTINIKNDTLSLKSVCPVRNENELEFKYLDAFFELAYATINDYKAICLIENIQDYFSYGLPIKLKNKEPIEYRIWGTISGCRNDNQELLEFLEKLPNDKPIIFDLRNGGFSPCLYELFDEYSQKKNLYYYGNKNEDNEWVKIKLKNSFNSKEQVIKTIANKQ